MSDMRLTSSKTKMKINLCIFLLCNTAVSVFGEPQELNRIVGESVKFPAAVKIEGTLRHSGVLLGDVTSSRFTAAKLKDRLQWDSSTGLFSLSALEMEDSGEYKVENTDQNIITIFQLNVYIRVSKPSVTFVSNKYPCTLQCTVEKGTQGTLFWYRESEKNPQGGSHFAIAPHWNQIQAMLGGRTYTCEANNSVSNNKTSVYLEDHCRGGAAGILQTEGSKMWSLCLVLIVMLCSRLV